MTPESAIVEVAANYGLNGLMVIALIYVVNRFDNQLTKRDEREDLMVKKMIEALENSASAMSELSTIIKDRRD